MKHNTVILKIKIYSHRNFDFNFKILQINLDDTHVD